MKRVQRWAVVDGELIRVGWTTAPVPRVPRVRVNGETHDNDRETTTADSDTRHDSEAETTAGPSLSDSERQQWAAMTTADDE